MGRWGREGDDPGKEEIDFLEGDWSWASGRKWGQIISKCLQGSTTTYSGLIEQ